MLSPATDWVSWTFRIWEKYFKWDQISQKTKLLDFAIKSTSVVHQLLKQKPIGLSIVQLFNVSWQLLVWISVKSLVAIPVAIWRDRLQRCRGSRAPLVCQVPLQKPISEIWNRPCNWRKKLKVFSPLPFWNISVLSPAAWQSWNLLCQKKSSRQSKVYPDSAMTRPIVKSFSSLHPPAAVWWTLNSCAKPVPDSGSTLAGLMVVLRRAKSGSKLRNCTFRTFGGLGLSRNAKYEPMIENGVTAILWNGKNTNKEKHLCCQKFNP